MSLPAPTSPSRPAAAVPDQLEQQQQEPTTVLSWSQELKERLERLARATSVNVDPYPGTPAYIAARKLEATIESSWRAYLVELVRNDLAAGILTGRRKHHWQKNECLIVYELVPGAQLEEFPSTDVAKREDYLARTVRDALYIKVPQFSSNFTFPWPSPTNEPAKTAMTTSLSTMTASDLVAADVKLRASSLVTPPQSPPPASSEANSLSAPRPTIHQRHTVSHPPSVDSEHEAAHGIESVVPILSHAPADNNNGVADDKSTNDSTPALGFFRPITPTPAPILAAAPTLTKSISAPSSPAVAVVSAPAASPSFPPSALASALVGIGAAHALGGASPLIPTATVASLLSSPNSPAANSKATPEKKLSPALVVTLPLSPAPTPDHQLAHSPIGLGLDVGAGQILAHEDEEDDIPLSPNPHGDDEEEASIHQARRASVHNSPSFRTLNPAISLDAEIERRTSPAPLAPHSPLIHPTPGADVDPSSIPAPELVYYGSGANSEDDGYDHDADFEPLFDLEEQLLETFKTLNPSVSLDAEIARRSPSPSPVVPPVQIHPSYEDEEDDEPVETFKTLNPAFSLEAEILRISRSPSPEPRFKELNEEFGLEQEIIRRSAASSPQPSVHLELDAEDVEAVDSPATPAPAPVAHAPAASSQKQVAKTTDRSIVRNTFTLPFLMGTGVLRLLNTINPFAYLLITMRARSHHSRSSSYPPEPYPKLVVPRPLLRRVLPAFIWRWAGKDAEYNLQRVGLGKGVNALGTRYDGTGSVVGLAGGSSTKGVESASA